MRFIRNFLIALLFTLSSGSVLAAVDINQADAAAIAAATKGVGLKKAEAIVAYRKQHGPFKKLEDLAKVKGIGMKTVEKNREYLSVRTHAK